MSYSYLIKFMLNYKLIGYKSCVKLIIVEETSCFTLFKGRSEGLNCQNLFVKTS